MLGIICCTLDCNLACTYCYEGNGINKKYPDNRLINDNFEQAMDKFDAYIDGLYKYNNCNLTTIILHGGEPTLINPNFFDILMERQKIKGYNLKWGIQTNGTMINDQYIDLFRKYNVNVGVSLDGLKQHHDSNRITKEGKPTFDIVEKNIEKKKTEAINVNLLLTISNENVNDIIDIYDYIANKNMHFNFNLIYPNKHHNIALDDDVFSVALCNLFDHWINDDKHKIIILPFYRIIEGILHPERGIPVCHWRKNCEGKIVAIDTKGNIYDCERWIGRSEMCLGNIEDGFDFCIHNANFFNKRAEILMKTECYNCEIQRFCYGGCPANAYFLYNDYNRKDSSICNYRKSIIKYIKEYMERNANM